LDKVVGLDKFQKINSRQEKYKKGKKKSRQKDISFVKIKKTNTFFNKYFKYIIVLL
jgi:hypothetical protein